MNQALLDAILRADFENFLRKCTVSLSPGERFIHNWHIRALAWHLEQVRLGKIKRLIINMPPRSLKSIAASVAFPAFVLGHDPTRRIICVSYGIDLAIKHANDFRAIIEAPWFRRLFPLMQLSGTKNTETEVATTQHGFRLATSVGGPLTGRGGDIFVIDDPLKPSDAFSAAKREAANQFFSNTLLSRLNDKRTGAIIIVMQRLHMDDLTGFVTAQSEDWTVLTLPAIAEADEWVQEADDLYHRFTAGEALQPEREPLEELERLRRQLGSDLFAAQYQQRPVPESGVIIKRDWVRRYKTLPPCTARTRIEQSWDTAAKVGPENDWSVCSTWQVEGEMYYLVDVTRGRFEFPALKAKALALAQQYSPTRILIEDVGTGTALIQELRKAGRVAVPVRAEQDKITRMAIQSAKFEAGMVYLPEAAPWLSVFEEELFAFPSSKYFDQVDTVSQILGHQRGITMIDCL